MADTVEDLANQDIDVVEPAAPASQQENMDVQEDSDEKILIPKDVCQVASTVVRVNIYNFSDEN